MLSSTKFSLVQYSLIVNVRQRGLEFYSTEKGQVGLVVGLLSIEKSKLFNLKTVQGTSEAYD